jgi:hypothetical protein
MLELDATAALCDLIPADRAQAPDRLATVNWLRRTNLCV